MLSLDQFDKARAFIYRHGDLLTYRRFAWHFEGGSKDAYLDALAGYQNADGGFGSGLEKDILAPDSTGIAAEMALGYLDEMGVNDGPVFEHVHEWIVRNVTESDKLPHLVEAIKRYPHGPWWLGEDKTRLLGVSGYLGKLGKAHPAVSEAAATVFEKNCLPLPDKFTLYEYPAFLFLEHDPAAERFPDCRAERIPKLLAMLEGDNTHYPLYFCYNRWESGEIEPAVWKSEAAKAVTTLQEDGGIELTKYKQIDSYAAWRPIWTLDLLVILKRKNLLHV